MEILDKNKHDRKVFNCGDERLNKFISEHAGSALKRNLSRTKVLIDTQVPSQIIGFHTLSYCEVAPPVESRLYKRYPHPLPALMLSRMAVDRHFQGCRLGEQLLLDVIFQVARVELEGLSPAPVVGLFVDAKNSAVKLFHQKYGFIEVDSLLDSLRLWLPIDACKTAYNSSLEA